METLGAKNSRWVQRMLLIGVDADGCVNGIKKDVYGGAIEGIVMPWDYIYGCVCVCTCVCACAQVRLWSNVCACALKMDWRGREICRMRWVCMRRRVRVCGPAFGEH